MEIINARDLVLMMGSCGISMRDDDVDMEESDDKQEPVGVLYFSLFFLCLICFCTARNNPYSSTSRIILTLGLLCLFLQILLLYSRTFLSTYFPKHLLYTILSVFCTVRPLTQTVST